MSVYNPDFPYLTADIPPVTGLLRASPEDFAVDEVPAYPPSGQGDHLFVRFRKRGLTTKEAVRRIAVSLGVDPRAAGWAGLKDRHAVTTQWASFEGASPDAARAIALDDLEVIEVVPHRHKLRTGHLRANRFSLIIRGAGPAVDRVTAAMSRFTAAGVPNYYGEQRFGRDGDNVPRARRWLVDGGRAPRGRFERKLLVSALQSALFNDVLAARLADGLFEVPVPGDLMRREETGGLFVTADLDEARARMAAWEISPTGPMFGTKMRSAEDEARRREESVLAAAGLDASHLARFGRAGEGARRPLRVRPLDATVTADGPDLRLAFELPAGAYATAITREILKERA